jgi:hypothetical protein
VPIDLTPLANVGAVGLILAWYLLQNAPRLDRIERAIDVLSKAILLDLVSRDSTSPMVRTQAESLLRTIDDKQRVREKNP